VTLFIGIDPGLKGGIAILPGVTKIEPVGWPMPLLGGDYNLRGIYDLIGRYVGLCDTYEARVIIEKVHAMPKQGISSAFNFGRGYGSLVTIATVLRAKVILVTPQRWKKVVLHDTLMDKPAALAYSNRMFPSIPLILSGCRKPHDGIADAVCIAEYGRIEHNQ
jgi:crossover junction endodeoxyribonuclease RuvC